MDARSPDHAAIDAAGIEARVRATLDALGVDYVLMPCDPALADTEAFCAAYGVAPEQSANTIVVASKGRERRRVACVLLATTRLDANNTVRRRLADGKVSFASAEETAATTGMMIGGVTPVALPDDVPVWVDARVMDAGEVVLGGGSRSMKVRISPEVFLRMANATVVEGLAVPR